jgi:hypothetical protein
MAGGGSPIAAGGLDLGPAGFAFNEKPPGFHRRVTVFRCPAAPLPRCPASYLE